MILEVFSPKRIVRELLLLRSWVSFYKKVLQKKSSSFLTFLRFFSLPERAPFVDGRAVFAQSTVDDYGLRFDIEKSFLDDKSGGFQLESSLSRVYI